MLFPETYPGSAWPHDSDHDLLGIVGQHAQALPRLPLSAFLLGLRFGNGGGRDLLGLDGGQHRAVWERRFSPT